ncbi:MAG: hypothetical protein ACOCQC_01075 [Halanaerobiaceae bacterium]
MGKANIKLLRTSQAVNSGRDYEIYIDNELKGKIPNGGEETFTVSPGTHTVLVKIDWAKSREMALHLEEGEKQKLLCGSRLVGWKRWFTLFYMFARDRFVYLEPYTEDKVIDYGEKTADDIRDKGILNFVFRHGIVGWGIPTGFIFALITVFFLLENKTFLRIVEYFGKSILYFMAGGVFYGVIMWLVLYKWLGRNS